ncbi:MAG: hypothetical protein FWF69_04950 [Firmicutes bacterium]|nr:hypothetical protein [Bacillota bacterium]
MKKASVLLLFLMLLCAAGAAMAENDVEANFEGGWVPVGETGYQVYLPMDWVVSGSNGGDVFSASTRDQSMRMGVTRKENQKTVEAIFAELSSKEGYTGVQIVTYNRRTFVTYKIPSSGAIGAVTLISDASYALWFTFTPSGDAGLAPLSAKILNSFAPNQ